jgi:hypothetical protein
MNITVIRYNLPCQENLFICSFKEFFTLVAITRFFEEFIRIFWYNWYCGQLATPLLTVKPVGVYFTPTDRQPSWGCIPPPLYSTCI